jgi:DNA-binding beta-propeller fold protein YncE
MRSATFLAVVIVLGVVVSGVSSDDVSALARHTDLVAIGVQGPSAGEKPRPSGVPKVNRSSDEGAFPAISGLEDPEVVAFDPVNNLLYAAGPSNSPVGSLQVVSGVSNTVTGTVSPPSGYVGDGTVAIQYDPLNGEVYVVGEATSGPASVWRFEPGTSDRSIVFNDSGGPSGLAVDSSSGDLFLPNALDDNVTVISGATNKVIASAPAPASPSAVAYASGNNEVYVGSGRFGNVSAINASSFRVVAPSIFSYAASYYVSALTYDPANQTVLVGWTPASPFSVGIIDRATDLDGPFLPISDFVTSIGFDSALNLTYVANWSGLAIANASSDYLSWMPFPTGAHPGSLAIDTANNTVYVSVPSDDELVVLNSSSPSQVWPSQHPIYLTSGIPSTVDAWVGCRSGNCTADAVFTWVAWPQYVYVDGDPGRFTATGESLELTGSASVTLNLTASVEGFNLTVSIPVVVEPPPEVSIAPVFPHADAGSPLTFQTSLPWNAAPPKSYRYSESTPLANCAFADSPSITCTPTGTGSFQVSVILTDFSGVTATNTSPVVDVYPALVVNLSISDTHPNIGQAVETVANTSGGSAPYTYYWGALPPGCTPVYEPTLGCIVTQSGVFNVTIIVEDANRVEISPAPLSVDVIFNFSVSAPAAVVVNQSFTIEVQTYGTSTDSIRTAPDQGLYQYSYVGLPPGCQSSNTSSLTCTPTRAGTYLITVSVNGPSGEHNSNSLVVKVEPPSLVPPVMADPWPLIGVYVAAAAAGAAASAIVIRRTRRKGPASPPE